MYIDNTYFRGDLTVPNSQDYPNSHLDGNKLTLTGFIEQYEVELMIYALGNETYEEFHDLFKKDGTLKDGIDQKWTDFIEGRTYEKDGHNFRWKGLLYKEGVFKKSLIADYVFTKYLEHYSTTFSGVGMATENPKNARRISSIPKIIEVWNRFITKYQNSPNGGNFKHWITSRGLTTGIDYYNEKNNYIVSMQQYLSDFNTDFSEVNMFLFETKNTFGI